MTRKSYDNDKIEKLLKELPSFNDPKSKQEWNMQLSEKHQKSKKPKRNKWTIPVLGTVTGMVVLLLLLVPLFNHSVNKQGTSESSSDSSGHQANEAAREQSAVEKKQFSAPTEDSTLQMHAADKSLLIQRSSPTMIRSVYAGKEDHVVVPVTFVSENGDEKAARGSLEDYQPAGLSINLVSEIQINYEQKSKTAVAVFPNEYQLPGNIQPAQMEEAIRWLAEPYHPENIQLKKKDGSAMKLANTKDSHTLVPVSHRHYVFYLYQSNLNKLKFLVPIPVDDNLTIRQSIQMLGRVKDHPALVPALPAHAEIKKVKSKGQGLIVEMQPGKWTDQQEAITAIEAILLTSKQYHFSEVTILHSGYQQLGPYDMTNPIQIPDDFNPLEVDPDK
ncbi:hypothetical protein Q7A53_02560 [Halobacillus rhizosphaerae]|uniref:hypothetical protein n=1 Tax=Halobacillus rhizosphaerae TaxID=3064889 RepID=UPI00398A8A2C